MRIRVYWFSWIYLQRFSIKVLVDLMYHLLASAFSWQTWPNQAPFQYASKTFLRICGGRVHDSVWLSCLGKLAIQTFGLHLSQFWCFYTILECLSSLKGYILMIGHHIFHKNSLLYCCSVLFFLNSEKEWLVLTTLPSVTIV